MTWFEVSQRCHILCVIIVHYVNVITLRKCSLDAVTLLWSIQTFAGRNRWAGFTIEMIMSVVTSRSDVFIV